MSSFSGLPVKNAMIPGLELKVFSKFCKVKEYKKAKERVIA